MACKYKVKLEASFINAALACEIMEGMDMIRAYTRNMKHASNFTYRLGIASKLYPDMKVQMIALPMVFKAEVMHGLKGMKLL